MEQVIYLEPDEEITSVLDKLKKTEERALILVVPKNATLLQSLVNLKLLSKRTAELEKEIALVTTDKTGRNLASLAGLTVHSSLKEKGKIVPKSPKLPPPAGVVIKTYSPSVERLDEPVSPQASQGEPTSASAFIKTPEDKEVTAGGSNLPPRRLFPSFKFPKPSIPIGFWLALVVSFSAVLAVLYFILPKATIVLSLKTNSFTQSLEMTVDQKAEEIDRENKIISGLPKELEKEEAKKFIATGKKNIGGKATGTVIISNNFKNPDGSGAEFPLKSGIELKDKKTGKLFLTNSAVTVPALNYSCDPRTGSCQPSPGSASVKVTASESGENYNLPASEFSIPGLGTSSVSGKSSENFSGGYDKFVGVVSESDISKAKEELTKDLFNKAKEELKTKLEKGQKILEGAVKEETISAEANVKPDTQVNDFEMKAKIKISTLTVKEKEYKELLSRFLESVLPSDKRLVSTPDDSIELLLLSYDPSLQIMKLKATLITQVAPKLNEERLKEEIAKKSLDEATSYLKNLVEVESVEIKPWPVWTKKLPAADKLKIKVRP